MKKILLTLLILTAIIDGCKKYDDGPLISFRSARNRLLGSYSVTQYNVNGVDSLSLYNDSMYSQFDILQDDNDFGYGISGNRKDGIYCSAIGHWKLNNDNTKLTVNLSTCYSDWHTHSSGTGPFINHATPEWEILRLTDKEVKMKTTYNGKDYTIRLETL
jgi:hypothetical protein